jgi:thiol-disulfide isomerase/thioredoxin
MQTIMLAALFASLEAATGWLNAKPLHAADLRGKVVLVEFWTYSCINWRRSSPHVRAWARTYRDRGLVVVGVHAPEFPFERETENVAEAVRETGIDYPIAIDNDFSVWRAPWPALYLIDAHGRIRYRHAGEGDYRRSEDEIRRLLNERGPSVAGAAAATVTARGIESDADWANLGSPETYLGLDRTVDFDSPGGATPGASRRYSAPARLPRNHWALSGPWSIDRTAVESNDRDSAIAYRFHARDVHLVMGPVRRARPIRFRVLLDGRPPGAAHGVDVDDRGYGTLVAPRLYHLIRQPGRIADRRIEIEFFDAGARAYAFTFG